MGNQAPREFFLEKRMRDLFPLLILPFCEDELTPSIIEPDGAVLFFLKMLRLDDAIVDQREYEAIDKETSQFFHEIERQGFPARAIAVQEADIRIKSHAFQRGGTVMRQHGIQKRQHGIDAIERRTLEAAFQGKCVLVLQNELIEQREVQMCGISFNTAHFIKRLHSMQALQTAFEFRTHLRKRRQIQAQRMVALHSFDECARVEDLSEKEIRREFRTLRIIFRTAILLLTMKPQEVKPKAQTDWLGFCKGGAQCPQSGRLCV